MYTDAAPANAGADLVARSQGLILQSIELLPALVGAGNAGQYQAQRGQAGNNNDEKQEQAKRAERFAFHGVDAARQELVDLGLIFWG